MIREGQLFGDGRYQILERIGRGGVGAVYRATQDPLGRQIALKILQPRFSKDAIARRRFTREARAVAALNHPSIATVFDFGAEGDGTLYLAMEYVEGMSLSEAMEQGLTPRHLIAILMAMLSALAYAHARGVIHRDLKPDNILIAFAPGANTLPSSEAIDAMPQLVKLVDFGIATVWNDPELVGDTNISEVVGTPLYMSPEQARGEHGLTPAVDIYTLGIVLFEGLTGHHPFAGLEPNETSMDIMIRHVTMAIPSLQPPPRVYVPEALRAIVRRCVEKRPRNRYASAAALREALGEAAQLLDAHAELQNREAIPLAQSSSWDESNSGQTVRVHSHAASDAVQTLPSHASEHLASRENDVLPTMADGGVSAPESEDGAIARAVAGESGHEHPNWSDLHADMRVHRFGVRFEVPLVGREAQRRMLRAAVEASLTRGVGQVCLVEGPTGIGKTKLATWLRESVSEQGKMRCLTGSFLRDNGAPLRALRDIFESLFGVRNLSRDKVLAQISARLRQWGVEDLWDAHALMAFLEPTEIGGAKAGGPNGPRQETLYALLVRTLERACRERPIFMLLDDIHWAGPELAEFLEFLAVEFRYHPCSLFVLCTARTDDFDSNPRLVEGLRRLSRYQGETVLRLQLEELSEAETSALTQTVLPADDRLLTNMVVRSNGNPLHLVQLLQYLYQENLLLWDEATESYVLSGDTEAISKVPPSLRDLLVLRVGQIEDRYESDGKMEALLRRCAVLGERFVVDVLIEMVRLEDNPQLEAFIEQGIDDLLQEAVLRHVSGRHEDMLAFNHALIRDVLLESMQGHLQLRRLHRLAGEAKLTFYHDRIGRMAQSIATHFINAGDLPRALELVLMAGNTARSGYHLREATRLYARATVLADQVTGSEEIVGRLSRLMGELNEGFGQFAEAQAHYAKVVQLALGHDAGTSGPPPIDDLRAMVADLDHAQQVLAGSEDRTYEVLRAVLGLGRTLKEVGHSELSRAAFERARALAASTGQGRWEHAATIGLGQCAFDRGEYDAAEELAAWVLERARQHDEIHNQAAALRLMAEIARLRGDPALTADLVTSAREAYERVDDRRHVAICLTDLAKLARARNDLENAARLFAQARQRFEELGDRISVAQCFNGLGEVARFSGRLTVAESCYQRAYDTFRTLGASRDAAISLVNLGQAAISAGSYPAAERALNQARLLVDDTSNPYLGIGLNLNLALLRAQQGRWDEIDEFMQIALDQLNRHDISDPDYARPLEELAYLYEERGDFEMGAALGRRADKIWANLGQSYEEKTVQRDALVDPER